MCHLTSLWWDSWFAVNSKIKIITASAICPIHFLWFPVCWCSKQQVHSIMKGMSLLTGNEMEWKAAVLLLQTNFIPKTHSIDYTYQSSDSMCKKKKRKMRRAASYFYKLRMQQNMSLWCFGFSHSESQIVALGMLSKRELIQSRQVFTLFPKPLTLKFKIK